MLPDCRRVSQRDPRVVEEEAEQRLELESKDSSRGRGKLHARDVERLLGLQESFRLARPQTQHGVLPGQ
jgi:hypothetical protein